ncbi:MAG: hypothetical protein ACKV2T_40575 [Kofleriaceae bacterium]
MSIRCSSRIVVAFGCALSLVGCVTDPEEIEPEVATLEQASTLYVLDDVEVKVNDMTSFAPASQYNGLVTADVELGGQEVAVRLVSGGVGLDATFYHPRKLIQIACSSVGTHVVNFPQLIDDHYDWSGRPVWSGKTNDGAAILYTENTPLFPPFIAIRKAGVAEQAIRQSPSIGGAVTAHVMTASGMVPMAWVGTLVKILSWIVEVPEFELETNDWLLKTKLSLAVKFKCKGTTPPPPAPSPTWAACPQFTGMNGFLCTCSVGFGSSQMNYCQTNVVGTACQGYAGPGSTALVNGTVTSCTQQ